MKVLLFLTIHSCLLTFSAVLGISEIERTVFAYSSQAGPNTPGVELVNQAAHSIHRRDITDSGAPTSGPSVVIQDNHQYYNKTVAINHPLSTYYASEFDRIFATYPAGTNFHLNNAKNRAMAIPLTFPFDFYGHPILTIAVTTGGFLFVNEISHPYLTFSQYIAPLMANFETKSPQSSIKYIEIENAFWVRWENMILMRNAKLGNFSFQCAIFTNGSIVFDYISIPISMEALKAVSPTLKVGLSDAFYFDVKSSQYGTVLRKIVKYSELQVPLDHVVTDVVIRFEHLPTCNQQTNCLDCNNQAKVPEFNCSWCYELNKCSSGVDRGVQEWLAADCHYLHLRNASDCRDQQEGQGNQRSQSVSGRSLSMSAGRVVLCTAAGVLGLGLACGVIGALAHGYLHPSSRLGLCLLRRRDLGGRIHRRLFGDADGAAYKVSADSGPYENFA